MARDYFDESKKKKKKETTQVQKVAKSPSVSQTNKNVNKKASNSTFMGGGSAVRNTEKTVSKSTTNKPQSFSSNNQPIKRQPAGRTTSARLTTAQRQKMGLNDQATAEERQSWREKSQARQEQARIKKMGLAPEDQPTAAQKAATDRAIKNTPGLIKKAGLDAASGYGQTLTDVIARTASSERGTEAKAMKMGIEKGTKQYQELEEERKRTAEEARKDNQSLYQKMQQRQAEWDEKTKDAKGLEKAYYGAVESGTGMLADTAIGLLTGTGQVGALASMGLRTYGSSANQARSEGATETEAAMYGLLQAGKEMGTEKIGGGGLAKMAYGKGTLGLGDIATNTLIKNLKGQSADLANMGVRLFGDIAEENIEELAGWGLDPLIKEFTYGRNTRERNARGAMQERSNALRAEIQNEDDARAAAAYLSSDDFLEQTANAYREAGLNKKDAEEVADRMRDYLTASLTGDTDSMEQIEDEVSRKVAGSHNILKDYSFRELKETFEATTLLVGATGLPGNISTMNRGNLVKEQLGTEGVNALASTAIDFEDSQMSTKAKAMKARIDSGKELTGTQVYELQAGMQEQVRKDTEREQSSRRMAARAIERENLLTPYRQNENGGIDLDEATMAAYRDSANKAGAIIDAIADEKKESITDTQKVDGSKAIAGFQTGVFTIEDANTLNYSNTTVRAAFEEATGVDLGQYVVKNKDGSVNIPATNTKTKDALFAMAADNLVKSAQAETQNWMDNAKGQVVTQVSARMGAQGSAVLQQALDDVDERDRSKYMMTANATDMLYQAARNMGTEWSDVASEATKMFPGISESKLKMMYEAGLADREMANDKARGRQVRMGQALTEMGEQETATGKVFIDTEVPVKGSVIRTFTEIAKNLGADIHFVDYIYDAENNPIAGANGSYDPNTNTFYLNVATGAETNIGYIFMHETTHYLKKFAPEQYQALENLVRERWFAFNPSQMQDAIARKIEAYKRATKGQQVLTEEQALEEIIADASHDFINDPEFARQVAEEDMGLAKAVLDSIRNALRMLRRIFASGSINDDTHMNSLFRELDIMTEAEKLWLDAYKVAVQNSAINAVNEWQDKVNGNVATEVEDRFSIVEDPELIKALDADRHRTTYRAMALIDGKLYPPMATQVRDANGKWTMQEGISLGQWVESDITTDPKMFNKEGKFLLKKDSGGNPVPAAYNPYIHSSDSMLNDQFAVAYKRPNMVVVEGEIPESELTSGYRAEHDLDDGRHVVAKDTTGITDWKAGVVQGKLSGKRTVFLTNHFKPTRIVPDSEVAKHIDGKVSGTGVVIPYNVVTPGVREELRKLGTQMAQSENPNYYVADAEEGLTINDGNARWTNERIDDLIGRYGASNPDYSQAYAVLMNPRDFLHITIEDELLRKWRESAASQPEGLTYKEGQRAVWDKSYLEGRLLDDQNFPLDEAELRGQAQTPFLYIRSNKSGQRVLGHEGRHRMRALMEAGVTSVPVVIEDPDTKTSKQNVDSMILGYQEDVYNGAGIVEVNDLVPIKESNRDELIQKFGGEAQVRFSVSEAPSIDELDLHNAIVEDTDGDPVAQFDEDGAVRFSISSYEAEGRKIYKSYLDKLVKDGELSQQEADDMLRELETIYGISKKFADSGKYAPFTAWSDATVVKDSKGRPVFSAIKKNSEYKMNIDFSTICKKRRTLDAVFREMINRGLFEQLDLNKDESAALVVNINNLIRQHKFEAACALCFVEARRYRQQQTAKTFADMWNGLVESMYEDKSKIAYFNFGEDSTVEDVPDGIHTMSDVDLDLTHIKEVANAKKNGKPVQTAEAKAARLILNNPDQRKLMRVGDMMASTGFENMQVNNPELMKVYNSKKGTGGAKSSFGDVQYLNEIIRSKTFDRLKAYDVSGVRIQSFSDYVPRMVFDYVQVIADLAAKKLPAHAYTKEVLFARQFGLTGAKINLSLVPDVVADSETPGLDKDGNYVWNEEGTFPYDEAMKLQEAEGYKDNCGTIAVGISDEQIWKMLADPTIQMVIPYHKSSLNPIVAAMTNVDRFTDYTDFQNTKDAEGKAVKKDFAWDRKLFRLTHDAKGNLLPKEKWGNVQDLVKEYAEWCESKNYTPKFSKFLYMEDGSINPGYYKLLEDFALLDNDGNFKPQGDVQMRFPTSESAFGSMEDLIKQGLSEDTALEAKRSEEISGIVDEIEGMMQEGTLTEQSVASEKLAQRLSISDTDSDGNILTDGQMEYFKNSQARDAEGKLIPVYHGTFRGPRITIFEGLIDGIWFTSDRSIAEDYSMGYEMGIPGALVGDERNPYDTDDEYFEKKGIRIEQDADGDWRAVISRNGREHYWGAAESKEDLIENLYAANENEELFDSQFTLRDYYPAYLNLENPRVIDCNGSMHDDVNGTGMTTRELAAEAMLDGYDGIIFRNVVDPFEAHDVYVAFSSNQVKDINNQNPTENPDIRYSFVDDGESKSRIAYEDAMDDSYELLAYYETQISNVNPETFNVTKAFKEEDVVKFLDALKAEDAVPSDDAKFEEDRVRRARSKEDFFNNVYAKWNDRWTTEGEVLKISSVKRDITNLVKGAMANSDSDAQYRNEIVRKTLIDARLAYQLMKQDRTELASYLLYHSARRMMDGLEFIKDDTAFKEYKEIRDFLRGYRINVPEEYWENEKFLDFRKEYYGRLRIGKGNSNIEDVYKDCQDRWPHLFNESEREKVDNLGDSPEDLLLHIGVVVDSNVTPFMEAYSSEEATSLAYDLADQLYEIIANGESVVSLADSYKERFDAKTKAMKARHAEAILRERKIREEGIQKEREKFRIAKERQKERQAHTKYFENIKNKYDELTKRLLTNTKDKHIPEQYKKELAGLLKAFDFQTVRSKEREARTGYKAKNTIKLEAMRTALEGIEANSQLFHINDSVTDIMKDLLGLDDASANKQSIEGKTLDELSAAELTKVDKLLGALLHEFNNYEKVRVGIKKQQAADIGHAQNNISLEHAELFGAGKDYQNTPGWVDKILNLDEMTAAYLFKRIDPNKEGLGLMYGEIRRSFDKYVRNQNQLNEWMEEIVGKYHSKGILWNKYGAGELTNWRSDNYAQNFTLENGQTIRLTVAQMMSLSCLANRQQAYDHIVGNGVVVSPVTFNAKILSDLKKKVNKALPVRLTDADIKNIVTALTPEQKQVANKLQELMATKMAEWGNEASINVIGIRLFEDPDYFPIRSDRGGLTKDLDPNQFEQAIRNFGFTKAVQPGARNAIMIDDIFDVVTEHCNNMNLYNSYTEAMNDFMKVYNYREVREEGEYTVEQALSHAFSQKAPTFIMQFMRDLNGNVSKRASGIEDAYNSLLANSKKAAVFANLRVAAQQPTAITRAFAVIDPKYMKGIKIEKGAMDEMFEHCPIALWKSWGYYDINMGKSIEDIMMNNGRVLEDAATELYGKLDNVTWTAIWQMVKAEMKDTHSEVQPGTDEYWELCNERMSEVVDLTQVVDSPMHRSHAMRDKGFLKKTATAFMAEPTLTFNMIRDGWISAKEAWQKGDKRKAAEIATRTSSVALLQAATVAGAAAVVDALRNKRPDKDDDEDGFLHLWWVNCVENFKSELRLWNKVYFVKDLASIFEGWDNANLALQGFQKFALGYRQLTGDPYARSSAAWYENMADGIGYMWGIPIKTVRTGLSNAMNALGLSSPLIDNMKENLDSLAADKSSSDTDKAGFIGSLLSDDSDGMFGKILTTKATAETKSDESEETSEDSVPTRESLPDNLSDEQKDEIIKSAERRAGKAKSAEEQEKRDYDTMLYDAMKASTGYQGEEFNKKIWQSVSKGYTERLAHGDYFYIDQMRKVVEDAGGDVDYFDQRVFEKSKSEFKKKMVSDLSPEDSWNMEKQKHYLTTHGMTDEQLSSEIVYKSDMAKDLKVAFRINDEEAIKETSDALALAGLTRQDFERIYKNRNRIDLTKYDGKYKDKLKSTGTFIWPTNGTITSYFGYRNAPTRGASSNHPAIDIGAPMGTEVVAADGGVVIYVGQNGGYGNSVGIKHDNGMVTYYNHLSAWNVKEGDTVAQGQPIANVGSTGISTGPHLDFKVLDASGEPVDPLKYLENKKS